MKSMTRPRAIPAARQSATARRRAATGACGVLLLLLAGPAAAELERRWGLAEVGGRPATRLCTGAGDGVPCAVAVCAAPGVVTLGVETAIRTVPGPELRASFDVDGVAETRDVAMGAGWPTHEYAALAPDDPLLARLAAGRTLTVTIADRTPLSFPLRGAAFELDRLLSACH